MIAAGEPLAWADLMALGFGVLGLAPDAFWSMTLKELAAAIKVVMPEAETPVGRDAMQALMRRYPDM